MDKPTLPPLMDRLRSLLERTQVQADRDTVIAAMDLLHAIVDREIKNAECEYVVSAVAAAIKKKWEETGDVPFPLYDHEAHALAVSAFKALRVVIDT